MLNKLPQFTEYVHIFYPELHYIHSLFNKCTSGVGMRRKVIEIRFAAREQLSALECNYCTCVQLQCKTGAHGDCT